MPLGRFICVEGVDGVGKTAAVETIAAYLRTTLKEETRCVRLPGGTAAGEAIREFFKTNVNSLSFEEQVGLLLKAKLHLLEEVVYPALAQGINIITDRYIDSLLAYQWAGLAHFDPRARQYIEDQLLINGIDCDPDLKLVLDCDPTIIAQRLQNEGRERDDLDRASASFKERVRHYYLYELKESPKGSTVFVNAGGTFQQVRDRLRQIMISAF